LSTFIESQCDGSPEELDLQKTEARRFETQQNIEDHCVYERQLFMMKEKPEAHTSKSELEREKQKVDFWCSNATGDKTIILRIAEILLLG